MIWSRILSITDVIVCVVNTEAVTTCPGGTPSACAAASASSICVAYHGGTVMAWFSKRLRLLDVLASGVENLSRDDDAVSAVLIEEAIDFEVERVSRDVPDDLVDADALAAGRITRNGAPEAHDEN